MNIGFSTGSIAKGDFKKALSLLMNTSCDAIELSALRENELLELIEALDGLDLSKYKYISFHAPSKINNLTEEILIEFLKEIKKRDWFIIIHPDIIKDFSLWRILGENLCIENMDKRKHCGQTTKDLSYIFEQLPEASFCFDIAHSRQVDPTMMEGISMLKKFKNRVKQLHVSDVNADSKHEPLNWEAIISYSKISQYIPNVPIILESPVQPEHIQSEIDAVDFIFKKMEIA